MLFVQQQYKADSRKVQHHPQSLILYMLQRHMSCMLSAGCSAHPPLVVANLLLYIPALILSAQVRQRSRGSGTYMAHTG